MSAKGIGSELIRSTVHWYVDGAERARVPFYCDPHRVGGFAVSPEALAAGDNASIFGLFVTLSMYQALRDVVIMRQQRLLPQISLRAITDLDFVKRSIARHTCTALRSADSLEKECDVAKYGKVVDCGTCPGTACHVKDATVVFNRMGDMGKLPSSAWLRLWKGGGVSAVLRIPQMLRDEFQKQRLGCRPG